MRSLVIIIALVLTAAIAAAVTYYVAVPKQEASKPTEEPPAEQPTELLTRLRAEHPTLADELEEVDSLLAKLELDNLELTAENNALRERLASYEKEIGKLNNELTYSYGSMDEAAHYLGDMLRNIYRLDEDDEGMTDEEKQAVIREVLSIGPVLEELEAFEDEPAKFAYYQAKTLTAMLELDSATSREVEQFIKQSKTAFLQLREDQANWDLDDAIDYYRANLVEEEEREEFDKLIMEVKKEGVSDEEFTEGKDEILRETEERINAEFNTFLNTDQKKIFETVFEDIGVMDVFTFED